MSLSLEVITVMYVFAVLVVFSSIILVLKIRDVVSVRSEYKQMAKCTRAEVEAARECYEASMHTFQGMLFTHPDEPKCELNADSKFSVLRIKGWNDHGEFDKRVPAPRDGWSHARIVSLINIQDLTVWDAYLGSVWVGSSEV